MDTQKDKVTLSFLFLMRHVDSVKESCNEPVCCDDTVNMRFIQYSKCSTQNSIQKEGLDLDFTHVDTVEASTMIWY